MPTWEWSVVPTGQGAKRGSTLLEIRATEAGLSAALAELGEKLEEACARFWDQEFGRLRQRTLRVARRTAWSPTDEEDRPICGTQRERALQARRAEQGLADRQEL